MTIKLEIAIDNTTPEHHVTCAIEFLRGVHSIQFAKVEEAPAEAAPAPKPTTVAPPPAPVEEEVQSIAPAKVAESVPTDCGELDSEGTPWDKRIHASTKSKVMDGTWKRKRGVEANVYEQVIAELKNRNASPQTTPAFVAAPPAPVAPAAPPAPAASPAAPSAPAPTGDVERRSYSELAQLVQSLFMGEKIDATGITRALSMYGYGSMPELITKTPEEIGAVYVQIRALAE